MLVDGRLAGSVALISLSSVDRLICSMRSVPACRELLYAQPPAKWMAAAYLQRITDE